MILICKINNFWRKECKKLILKFKDLLYQKLILKLMILIFSVLILIIMLINLQKIFEVLNMIQMHKLFDFMVLLKKEIRFQFMFIILDHIFISKFQIQWKLMKNKWIIWKHIWTQNYLVVLELNHVNL